ncbi:MAG TPA: recombinase family protein [Candidatus Binatia bacterium]|nr:recombinase family protein [Candidatus Binatia bacterium]
MRALLYARVSTADKEQDPRPQLEEMREHCRRRGWTIAGEFVEKLSAAKARPQFLELRAAARARRGDVVLCRHFDRVARSTRELLELLDEFRALGVEFISLNQQIDTTTPAGKLMFTMIAAFAEFERSMTRERVMLGLAAARAKGKRLGRPRAIVDAARIGLLWRKNPNIEAIARSQKLSPSTVRRRLESSGILQKPPQKRARKSLISKVD